jgi:cell division protein FtsQ
MLRKLFKLTGYLVLMMFFIITLAFTSHESRNITCRNIEIEFGNDELIKLSKAEIARMIKSADSDLTGKRLEDINAEVIEKEVEKNPAVLKAEVFKVVAKDTTSYKGILTVRVKHRRPVVRVMAESGSYYLDKFGDKIPISTSYTANVLVATGYFSEKYAKEQLLPFVLFIENDEFWKAQIEQVHVEKNDDVILTPLVGDQIIELGKLQNFREKLRNMKAFYNQVLANNNWNKYERVSLKFKNQVVAKKR